jgi:hypothetical protein
MKPLESTLDVPATSPDFVVEPLRLADVPAVAELHMEHFGEGELVGNSVAKFGRGFLEEVFYRLNLENPLFHCAVARYRGEVIGFSVFSTDRQNVFSWTLRHRFAGVALASLRALAARPSILPLLLSNVRYAGGSEKLLADSVRGWWIVAAVRKKYRGKEFMERTGVHVADALFRYMDRIFEEAGCRSWYGVVHPKNGPINAFLRRRNAKEIGRSHAQGQEMAYYVWSADAT